MPANNSRRAKTRLSYSLSALNGAKDGVGDAIEYLEGIRGFSRHRTRLEQLHDEIRQLKSRILQTVAKVPAVKLTAQARRELAASSQARGSRRSQRKGGRHG